MKIKIIDLLNKNEKPKKIKYKNYIWNLDKNGLYDCEDIAIDLDIYLANVQVCDLRRNLIDVLNDEVEIIEERPKEIEKDIYNCHFKGNGSCYIESKGHEYDFPYYYVEKINEIIDKVNYLLKKEEDKK